MDLGKNSVASSGFTLPHRSSLAGIVEPILAGPTDASAGQEPCQIEIRRPGDNEGLDGSLQFASDDQKKQTASIRDAPDEITSSVQ